MAQFIKSDDIRVNPIKTNKPDTISPGDPGDENKPKPEKVYEKGWTEDNNNLIQERVARDDESDISNRGPERRIADGRRYSSRRTAIGDRRNNDKE